MPHHRQSLNLTSSQQASQIATLGIYHPHIIGQYGYMSIENLKTFDPFAEADEDTGETKQSQNYIHIRIQQRNGRKTLTTVQGLPKKFDQKKILKVIKKKFACNGTIVNDTEMGEVIQLQGDQRKDVQEFLVDKKEGLGLDAKTIKSGRNVSRRVVTWIGMGGPAGMFVELPLAGPVIAVEPLYDDLTALADTLGMMAFYD
ncbi:MAG: hypothetical protein Q9170_001909 [Blastenia crenularia]